MLVCVWGGEGGFDRLYCPASAKALTVSLGVADTATCTHRAWKTWQVHCHATHCAATQGEACALLVCGVYKAAVHRKGISCHAVICSVFFYSTVLSWWDAAVACRECNWAVKHSQLPALGCIGSAAGARPQVHYVNFGSRRFYPTRARCAQLCSRVHTRCSRRSGRGPRSIMCSE